MSDPPADPPPDRSVRPARRFGRGVRRFLAPFLWALALLGAAVTAFPHSTGGDVSEPDTMRGLSRVAVSVGGGLAFWEAVPGHPRVVTVTVLGPELPPDPRWPAAASEEELEDGQVPFDLQWQSSRNPRFVRLPAAGLAAGVGANREGFYRSDAAMLGGFFGDDPGPMCWVVGLSISVWPLALAAGLWGAWRVWRGDRPRADPGDRRALRRRLARPWVLGLAGLAAVALVGYVDLSDGRGPRAWVSPHVGRGPAGVPHPRTVSLEWQWMDPPAWTLDPFCAPPGPTERVGDGFWNGDRPRAGVWANVQGVRDREGPQDVYGGAGLSLWWLAAAAAAWNLLTLARHRRRVRRDHSAGDRR